MRDIVIAVIGIAIAAVVWSGWQAYQHTTGGAGPVACTTEARLCPDGSYVGRSGPHCEFAACPPAPASYQDATFTIDGMPVTLASSGVAYFGNEAAGDLNGDGKADVAFILTDQPGGSGTFYYAVAALATADGGYQGTNAFLLGDRIAPQTTEIKEGTLIVNYADRKPTEPMTAKPSVGVSTYLRVVDGQLQEASRAGSGGIRGTVMLGPTCPVERIPPDPACADKGYAATFDVTTLAGTAVIKAFSSKGDGTFSVDLPAGTYAIHPAGTSMLPRCASVDQVSVTPGSYAIVAISCDSGIR